MHNPALGASHRGDIRKSLFLSDWAVDTVAVVDGTLTATGWYSRDAGTHLDVLVNGVVARTETYNRGDLAQIFEFLLPEREVVAFTATTDVLLAEEYRFDLSRAAETVASYYYPVNQALEYPIPPAHRVQRVNGITDTSVFKRSGYTNYRIISDLLRKNTHKTGPIRILDWGCGCGSIGRYFLSAAEFEYEGCDIDHDNLDWCRENLDRKSFFRVPLSPPCAQLSTSAFDCIFGVSVISHLRKDRIIEWASWLALNLRPGGVLLLTTLGLQATSRMSDLADINAILDNGILFGLDSGHEIGRIIGDTGFYGTSFQTPDHLESIFRKNFELLDFKQGGIGHQDILIFRRRG